MRAFTESFEEQYKLACTTLATSTTAQAPGLNISHSDMPSMDTLWGAIIPHADWLDERAENGAH